MGQGVITLTKNRNVQNSTWRRTSRYGLVLMPSTRCALLLTYVLTFPTTRRWVDREMVAGKLQQHLQNCPREKGFLILSRGESFPGLEDLSHTSKVVLISCGADTLLQCGAYCSDAAHHTGTQRLGTVRLRCLRYNDTALFLSGGATFKLRQSIHMVVQVQAENLNL